MGDEEKAPRRVVEGEWELTIGWYANYSWPDPIRFKANKVMVGQDDGRHVAIVIADNGTEQMAIAVHELGIGFSVKALSLRVIEAPLPFEEHVRALLH